MSKLTDNLDLADFGNTPQRAAKTLQAATEIGAKNELTSQEMDILIEADYYKKMVNLNHLVKSSKSDWMKYFL